MESSCHFAVKTGKRAGKSDNDKTVLAQFPVTGEGKPSLGSGEWHSVGPL